MPGIATAPAPVEMTEASIAALVAAKQADEWVPADPMIGKRVRYMGREWAFQNTEWTVIGYDRGVVELVKPGCYVPFTTHRSMIDVIG